MILKAFKEKSNQKFINTLLSNRKVEVSDGKMKTVGVLLDDDQYLKKDDFVNFFKDLNLLPSDQKFLIFSKTDSTNYNKWDDVFESKDFGWKGKIKNNDLQNFINYKFDVLISFYTVNEIELNQVTAMSQANFKVGISNYDERLYDLIIDIAPSNFKNFKTEFKKYITILNKL